MGGGGRRAADGLRTVPPAGQQAAEAEEGDPRPRGGGQEQIGFKG